MPIVYFDNGAAYITSTADKLEQLARYDAIILALQMQALEATSNVGLTEYNLDDGQTKIRAAYRGPDQIITAIMGYKRLRNMLEQEISGRKTILVDRRNFYP